MSEPALIILSPTRPVHAPELRICKKGPGLRQYVDNKKNYFVAKRLLDIIISSIVIITILSWLLPLLALLIKCTSGGPVLFLQKRTGRGGRSFTCYKLRTMGYTKCESYTKSVTSYPLCSLPSETDENIGNTKSETSYPLCSLPSETDKNIGNTKSQTSYSVTPLGRFLRTSNLDELPQFFNVLLGQMSIVGPRPHMHADCNAFSLLIPGYKFRNLVKPGITGWAQVKGYHGKVTSRECIIKRYEWDARYIREAGFWLDIKIMATTATRGIGIVARYLISASFAPTLRSLRCSYRR